MVHLAKVAEQSTHRGRCKFEVSLVGRFDVSLEPVSNCPQTNFENRWFPTT